jgi:hypothetical protein
MTDPPTARIASSSPELIPALWTAWRSGTEGVRARRVGRSETGWRRTALDAFHLLFRTFRDDAVPSGDGVFGLLDRRAARVLDALPEHHHFLPEHRRPRCRPPASQRTETRRIARHQAEPARSDNPTAGSSGRTKAPPSERTAGPRESRGSYSPRP